MPGMVNTATSPAPRPPPPQMLWIVSTLPSRARGTAAAALGVGKPLAYSLRTFRPPRAVKFFENERSLSGHRIVYSKRSKPAEG